MSDPNKRAVALAVANATRNGLANVCIREGEGFAPWPAQTFDLIACNPPLRTGKATVLDLFFQAAGKLQPGGSLWTVIRPPRGPRVISGSWRRSSTVELVALKGGYRVYRAAVAPGHTPQANPG